jgi:hypothetical protein
VEEKEALARSRRTSVSVVAPARVVSALAAEDLSDRGVSNSVSFLDCEEEKEHKHCEEEEIQQENEPRQQKKSCEEEEIQQEQDRNLSEYDSSLFTASQLFETVNIPDSLSHYEEEPEEFVVCRPTSAAVVGKSVRDIPR